MSDDNDLLNEKHSQTSNNVLSLMWYVIIFGAMLIAVGNRQYSIIKYESIIHEFDPWFNYRSTLKFINDGFYEFINWFDELAWYPLGRIVGGTVFPGLMLTAGNIYHFLKIIGLPVDIKDCCVFLAPAFSTLTVLATYLLTKELWNDRAGLVGAVLISIVPGYISRSVAGSYDNEGIAIFALVFTFYLWLKCFKTGSIFWAVLASISYAYMAAAWGGYVFIINIVPIHVLVTCLCGLYSDKIYLSYSIFYVFGLIMSMQTPFVGFSPVKTSEHIGSMGVFGLLQIFAFVRYVHSKTSQNQFKKLLTAGAIFITCFSFIALVLLTFAGVIAPWTGRFYSLFDTNYAKIHMPLITSVAEHQPTTWSSFAMDLHLLLFPMLYGLWVCIHEYNAARIFAIIYALFAVYFAGVMIRLILTLTPIVCILAAIGISKTLDNFVLEDKEVSFDPSNAKEKAKSTPTNYSTKVLNNIVVTVFALFFMYFMVHSTWVTRYSYSSPSVILASDRPDGSMMIIDDYREAYLWLRTNTDSSARIMSWWDYGYQITGFANRTTIVDNNTWNNTHIALVGRAMSSNESEAYKIARNLNVNYVLVIFGGMIGYSGDDINKFLWMIRISQAEFPMIIKEREFFSIDGEYAVGKKVSKTMRESLMYKLSYYNFGQVRTSMQHPPGFDHVRNEEIMEKNIFLTHFEEAFTSSSWIVRIYKLKDEPLLSNPVFVQTKAVKDVFITKKVISADL